MFYYLLFKIEENPCDMLHRDWHQFTPIEFGIKNSLDHLSCETFTPAILSGGICDIIDSGEFPPVLSDISAREI